jgi:hypothetical protein
MIFMVKVKGILVLFFIIGLSYQIKAQHREDDERSFWERTYFGGGLALQFGRFTYIDISPMMGYGFTNRFSTGIGFTYQYVDFGYSYSAYGGRLFSRYGILTNIFAHAEFEMLNWENRRVPGEIRRQWSDAVFIGGGYSSHLGGQQGFQAYILYNLNHDYARSSYDQPYVIRFSVTF